MSVRFILGRAGTGKTHHCLTSIRRELESDPECAQKLILLVPEQASLQMERALLASPGPGATPGHWVPVVREPPWPIAG